MNNHLETNHKFAIRARGLSKQFGNLLAVNNLDLDIPHSQIFGFLGPNGSGKSTTIRLLCGLLSPSQGSAEVLGFKIPESAKKLKPKIGYMTQKFSLYGDLSVIENLQFISNIYCYERKARKVRIEELLERYDLRELSRQMASTLSGGQKQRLALACAVLNKPELLLLDEPTSAVDPKSRRDFWKKLFELADSGTTILVSTHYMDEAERCHRLAILDHGRKVAAGSPQELQENIGVSVVEVQSTNTSAIQNILEKNQNILSVTQLGVRLRVLVPASIAKPLALVEEQLGDYKLAAQVSLVPPSLEDVFVVTTYKKPSQDNITIEKQLGA
ncbi:ABC transporter ATP-binding protein [Aurantivibrio infirmus]